VLPGISLESPSHLGWLGILLKLIDLLSLPNRLTVHCVLEAFDHRLEVRQACLDKLEALHNRRQAPRPPNGSPRSGQA
jgi:hypothetical protein